MQLLCIAEHILISFLPSFLHSVRPSVLTYLLTYLLTYFRPPVSEMTYTVSSGTLNSYYTIPYPPSSSPSLTPSFSFSFLLSRLFWFAVSLWISPEWLWFNISVFSWLLLWGVLVVGFKRQLVVGCWENQNKRLDWTPLPGNSLWLGRDWYTSRKSTTRQAERKTKALRHS